MNGKLLLDLVGNLDPCIVLDAEPDEVNSKKLINWKSAGAVAACVLVFSCVGIGIRQIAQAKKTAYTVYPGNSEWNNLGDVESKVAACRIPEEDLREMTDDDLVEAILEYPFLLDLFTADDVRSCVKWQEENCDALRELIRRGTATELLLAKVKELYIDVHVEGSYDFMNEQRHDALCLILFYAPECRKKLTEEDVEILKRSSMVKDTIRMCGDETA